MTDDLLATPIQFLPTIGPQRAACLAKELSIHTYAELLGHYPLRYEDRTRFCPFSQLPNHLGKHLQVKGVLRGIKLSSQGRTRLEAFLVEGRFRLKLVWFHAIGWVKSRLVAGQAYHVFGKLTGQRPVLTMIHPELTNAALATSQPALQPVYSTTQRLTRLGLSSPGLRKALQELLACIKGRITDYLPAQLLAQEKLLGREEAWRHIHFPPHAQAYLSAQRRLAFAALFTLQLRLLQQKAIRKKAYHGILMRDTTLVHRYYQEHLPFALTQAQKRVVKEIYADMASGRQMNRLLQGDVGSGKTMVAFFAMLLPWQAGLQVALMAPTTVLAEQHYHTLKAPAQALGKRIGLLHGAIQKTERQALLKALATGEIDLLVGTHALLESQVDFPCLGLVVIDEQHRFGVAQRALLWQQGKGRVPHVLVMTATPIPRTLAMTLYAHLDHSVLEELPPGRQKVITVHREEAQRLRLFGFLRKELAQGHQAYVVYPLIHSSEQLAYKSLIEGYEAMCRAFPEHHIGIVHGGMKPADKAYEMARFTQGETALLVATTVIEVGVNVPNATVMVIENAERFGLTQLHQLRGRVGRGTQQAYCILMTEEELSPGAQRRIQTLVRYQDGFAIAAEDLRLRGPGDLLGLAQSGRLEKALGELQRNSALAQRTYACAQALLKRDPTLALPEHKELKAHLSQADLAGPIAWEEVS